MRVAIDTPSISILLHKRSARVEWIAALRAEEVSSVPLSTARHNHLTFNRCLARLASRREHLVEVEMAEEALRLICAVFVLEPSHVIWSSLSSKEWDILTTLACANARDALREFVVWFRVEGNTLEMLSTLVACEALRVEPQTSRRDDTTSNR
jgi:hypothetical protein